jgi:hypothetical protein
MKEFDILNLLTGLRLSGEPFRQVAFENTSLVLYRVYMQGKEHGRRLSEIGVLRRIWYNSEELKLDRRDWLIDRLDEFYCQPSRQEG